MTVKRLMLAVVVCMTVSCSSLRVSQDYDPTTDFSRYRSFDLSPRPQPETGDIRVDNPLLDARIRNAVTDTLYAMDYRRVSTPTPDFFVVYYLVIRAKLEGSTYSTGVGFGTWSYPYWGSVGYETTFRQFDEGMLVIDFIDAEDNRLIWRGIGTRRVSEHEDPQKTTEIVRQTVSAILAQFPPQSQNLPK